MINFRKTSRASTIFLVLAPALGAQSTNAKREADARAFWAKPTSVVDFVAVNIRGSLRERVQPFASANTGLFQNSRYGSTPTTKVWVDSASQAITAVLDFTVERSLKPAASVCSFFLDMMGEAVGVGYPRQARNNALSHYMPPSVFPADSAILGDAYDYLLKRMVTRVVVYETVDKRQYWCERNVMSRDVVVREGDETP